MLTNNLFNSPFYIFEEELGQDELPEFLEISLPLFLQLGRFLHSHLLASPGAGGVTNRFSEVFLVFQQVLPRLYVRPKLYLFVLLSCAFFIKIFFSVKCYVF